VAASRRVERVTRPDPSSRDDCGRAHLRIRLTPPGARRIGRWRGSDPRLCSFLCRPTRRRTNLHPSRRPRSHTRGRPTSGDPECRSRRCPRVHRRQRRSAHPRTGRPRSCMRPNVLLHLRLPDRPQDNGAPMHRDTIPAGKPCRSSPRIPCDAVAGARRVILPARVGEAARTEPGAPLSNELHPARRARREGVI
jgi:hypothetical protein